jgi:hypothetical protein
MQKSPDVRIVKGRIIVVKNQLLPLLNNYVAVSLVGVLSDYERYCLLLPQVSDRLRSTPSNF